MVSSALAIVRSATVRLKITTSNTRMAKLRVTPRATKAKTRTNRAATLIIAVKMAATAVLTPAAVAVIPAVAQATPVAVAVIPAVVQVTPVAAAVTPAAVQATPAALAVVKAAPVGTVDRVVETAAVLAVEVAINHQTHR